MNKVSCADRAGTVVCGLAGNYRAGPGIFLARHGHLHTVAIFSALNFEREEFKTALLSIYIFSDICAI